MPDGQLPGVVMRVRGLVAVLHDRAATDRDLLERFVSRRDEAAFAALLERHGAMVLGVCRRVLHDAHDAEDACQATFLALARKAPSVRKRDSLASWLYGVAVRVSRNLRRGVARRRARAGPEVDVPQPDAAAELTWREVREALDEELRRLPEPLRAPLVLCCLEGLSRDEAAQQLRVSPGALKGRLERARGLLRARLSRRGVTLSAACLAATLGPDALAAVPPALALATRKAALRFGSGAAAPGLVSPRVAGLVDGVTRGTFGGVVAVGAAVVGLTLLITGLCSTARQTPAGQEQNPAPSTRRGEDPQGPAEGQQARTDLYGDPLPPGAVARLGTLRFRHGEHIRAIAFSPDGQAVASAGGRGGVVFHDLATGKRLRSFPGESDHPSGGIYAFAFAPDGKTWAAAVAGRRVCVGDMATGKQIRRLDFAEGQVRRLAFSHDGRTLAAAAENHKVQVWDVRAGKELGRIAHPRAIILSLALSPDGKTLATAGMDELRAESALYLWDTASGRGLRQWQAHLGEVYALAFSPDGKRLASANVEGDNRLRVWRVPTGERQLDLPGDFTPGQYTSVGFSPSGKVLAAVGGDSVSLLEADTGKELRRIARGTNFSLGNPPAAFSPDGKILALADPWTITLWDMATGAKLGPALDGHDRVVERVMFLPDGKTLASTAGDGVYYWHVHTGRRVGHFTRSPNDYSQRALSPDGKTLAVAGEGEIELWDTATGKQVGALKGLPKYSLNTLTFTPDGKTLAAMVGDETVRIWDARTARQVRQFTRPTTPVTPWPGQSLAFSPDGRTLAVGSSDKDTMVRLLEVATARGVRQAFKLPGATGQIAFSADGKVLAAATEGPGRFDQGRTILVWELRTGRALCRLKGVSSYFALSPDGKSLVTVGDTPRLWEVATGKERGRLRGHADTVWAAAFSPDGRWLATGSQDTTVLIWDVSSLNREPPGSPVTPGGGVRN
jgi:RNA polymerase sigma factor (sigma-70 family)